MESILGSDIPSTLLYPIDLEESHRSCSYSRDGDFTRTQISGGGENWGPSWKLAATMTVALLYVPCF
jgi:hypothetical protein